MKGLSREDKKAIRETRREIKLERRYGNPVMRKVALADPLVKPYYDRYKQYRKQETHSIIWALVFVAFATLHILAILFDTDESIAYGASVDMMVAMFWLCNARVEDARADLVRHEFVQYANDDAILETGKALGVIKDVKEVKNGAHTQTKRSGRGHRSGLGGHGNDSSSGASR